jgi:hypothetical protein
VFVLTDVGVALAVPCWRRVITAAGDVMPGVDPDHHTPAWYVDLMHVTDRGGELVARDLDGLRRWQRFLDTYVHRDRDPRAAWSDFPPKAIENLAALPSPLGPVVTWQG